MQARTFQPHVGGGVGRERSRASVSGNSTDSHETPGTAEFGFENARLFARVKQHAHPGNQDGVFADRPLTANSPYHYGEIEQIRRFNNSQGAPLDPALRSFHSHNPSHHSISQNDVQTDDGNWHDAEQAQAAARATSNETPQPDATGTDAEKKQRRAPSTTAANERELRELLEKNEHRSLEQIGKDVRSAERSQKSERAKQLFAMRWLRAYCKQSKESVPRNRVYTHYAQRCGTDRVDTLNPASFGKLVRIIFPGIQTRRLGVRGESKYHYVNLALSDEPQYPSARLAGAYENAGQGGRDDSMAPDGDYSTMSRLAQISAGFSTHDGFFDKPEVPPNTNPKSRSLLFADSNWPRDSENGEPPQMYQQTLQFSSTADTKSQDDPMILPDIQRFVPPKTDIDTANALTALYRTHCTSLIDAVRYVKEKQFTKLLGSFNGTLTVPVSKLFSHPALAHWIKMCDWMMYQQTIRFVSQLALQVIPPQVFSMLGKISDTLTDQLTRHFQHYPSHVLQAKMEPATVFSSLLRRLLRVNETAHAAANLLTNDDLRNMMWQDWVRTVHPRIVCQSELPNCGHVEVYAILTQDVRQLLEPLSPSQWFEAGTEFEQDLLSTQRNFSLNNSVDLTAESILDRWAFFLKSLPGRFPNVQTRTLLHCISGVGTAALRDITVSQAQSFGSWWITKCWIDEMMLWLAEMGGFLESRAPLPLLAESPHDSEIFDMSFESGQQMARNGHDPTQSGGLGIDFQHMPHFAPINEVRSQSTGPPTATFRFPSPARVKADRMNFSIHDDNHDDSGIGMSLIGNVMGLIPSHDFARGLNGSAGQPAAR